MTVPTNNKFQAKKERILRDLARSTEDYDDLSPKGTVDEDVRELIGVINSREGLVTTSSCSGRVSVFLEGGFASAEGRGQGGEDDDVVDKHDNQGSVNGDGNINGNENGQEKGFDESSHGNDNGNGRSTTASTTMFKSTTTTMIEASTRTSPKGNGGRWLYVSHSPISPLADSKSYSEIFGLQPMHAWSPASSPTTRFAQTTKSDSEPPRFVHFKFEPMILHILASSPSCAQTVLTAALQSGFRESGISNITSPTPMVAVRTAGLALDCIIGWMDAGEDSQDSNSDSKPLASVDERYLEVVVNIVNERFVTNERRKERFQDLLMKSLTIRNDDVQNLTTKARQARLNTDGRPWEDAETRRERKKVEGLQRQAEIKKLNVET